MKNLLSTFVLCFGLIMTLSAQKVLEQGYLKMEITEVGSEDEQVAAMLEMMKGSQTEIYFKDGKNMSSMNMMGGMMQTKSLSDSKTGEVNMLFDMMGQKMHIESNKDDMTKASEDQAEMFEGFKVEYVESDTKEILGHKCVKTKIVDPKTNEAAFELYVARGIKADSKMLQGLQFFDIDGFPMELNMKQAQFSMTMTTIEMKEEVPADVFKLDTAGYQKMTFEEFVEKMGAMGGGGFGF